MQYRDYDRPEIKELEAIWEPRKEYIEKDLWVIRNFLSEEEIEWLLKEARDPDGWYVTKRSPYKNVLNKFLHFVPEYLEDGTLKVPDNNSVNREIPYFNTKYGIQNRLQSVVPRNFIGASTLQSFFGLNYNDSEMIELANKKNAIEEDFAYPWHCEEDSTHPVTGAKMTAAFSVYINDDFDGGNLEFLYKPDIVIKPEPGLLINIPMSKEFTHKISLVTNGNRHTIYGSCWDRVDIYPISTSEDC